MESKKAFSTQLTALAALVLILVPQVSFAFGKRSPYQLSREACLKGAHSQLDVQASHILLSALGVSHPKLSDTIDSLAPGPARGVFNAKLHQSMETIGCAFDDIAQFDTVEQVMDAIEIHSYKISPSDTPKFLRPGFVAIMAGIDSDNTIVIETTTDGFVFHVCEADPNTFGSKPPAPTPNCQKLLNGSFFIPIDEMLEQTSGLKAAILTVLKAIGSMSIIVTSNLGLTIASPAAQVVSTVIAPDPIASYERDHMVDVATQDMLSMGQRRAGDNPRGEDGMVVTRLLPYSYADLKSAMIDILKSEFKDEYDQLQSYSHDPNDPNILGTPALKMERDFRDRMLKQIQDAATPAPAPSPTSSPTSSGSMVPTESSSDAQPVGVTHAVMP